MKPCSLGEREQRLALGERQRVAGRVLEVGDDVRELRRDAAVEQRRDSSTSMPSVLELDHAHVGAEAAQAQQRAVVRRLLDDDGVAGRDELANRNASACIEPFVTSTCVVDAVLLGDPRAQWRVADAVP